MSQWLVVDGVRYDLQEAIQEPSIRSLVDLQKAAGISVTTIAETLVGMGGMKSATEIFDSVERLNVFAALVFLCRRKAGERDLTFDEASEVSLANVSLDFEDDDEVEDDPKDPSTPEGPGSE